MSEGTLVGLRGLTPSLVSLLSCSAIGIGLAGAFRCMAAKAVSAMLEECKVVK